MEQSKIIDTLETYQISLEQELAAAEKVFRGLLCWFPDFREFIVVELGQMKLCGPHEVPGRAPWGTPWCLVGHCFIFSCPPEAFSVSYVQKKISKKFRGIWTSFGTDILENQKQAKNSNWPWALS